MQYTNKTGKAVMERTYLIQRCDQGTFTGFMCLQINYYLYNVVSFLGELLDIMDNVVRTSSEVRIFCSPLLSAFKSLLGVLFEKFSLPFQTI